MAEFDPVTDFLTREQEALGELGPEINFGQQPTDVFAPDTTDGQDNGSYVFLNGDSKPDDTSALSASLHPSSDPQNFESQAHPQLAPSEPNNPFSNGLLADATQDSSHAASASASVFGPGSEQHDAWRQAFNERIAKKDAEEEKLLAELKETGKKELENWYKHYQSQLQTRARELREARAAAENGDAHGTTLKPTVADKEVWEKVCNMCDFQAKQKSVPDMTRMRGILLSLKPSS